MLTICKLRPDPVIDFAAVELKKYLRMMMPECGDIDIRYAPDAGDGFRLGLLADFGLETPGDPVLDDTLHIDTGETGGVIAGSNSRSVRPARTVRRAIAVAIVVRAAATGRAAAGAATGAAIAVRGPSTQPRTRCVRAASSPPRRWPRARRPMRRGTPRHSPSSPLKARCASRTSTFPRR